MVGEREVKVRLRADIDQYQRAMREASLSTSVFGRNTSALKGPLQSIEQQSSRSGKEIDKLSGRLRVMTDAALTLGPALLPLGAAGFPLLAAGAASLGAAAGGIAVAALAFHGLGDALKALDAYQLDKTPENLAKLNKAFADAGPAGAQFVQFIDELEPKLKDLQNIARNGLLPGVEEGINDLLTRLPEVKRIVRDLSQGVGELAAEAGGSLAGPKFTAFFDYLESDARPTLEAFARSAGNLVEVFANLTVAFAPLTRGFTGGLEGMTRALAEWSRGLDQNDSFQSFLNYIRESGPQAIAFLGSLAKAFAAIVEAAAPYGTVVLPALTALADVFGTIAASDIGGPLVAGAAALTLFNRGQQAFNKVTGTDAVASLRGLKGALSEVITAQDRARLSAAELQAIEAKRSAAISGGLKTIGKGAALYAGLGIAASGAADGIGLTNTASLAMMGLIGGPWGAAVGAGVGLLLDWRANSSDASQAASEFTTTLDQQTGAITDNTRALAVKRLEDSGALKAAQDLGISLQLVTDAALGNTAAQEQLNAALAGYDGAVTHLGGSKGSFSAGFDADAQSASKVESAVSTVSDAVGLSLSLFGRQSSAMGGTVHATNDLRAAYDRTADAAAGLTEQVQTLDDFLNKRGTFRSYQADIDALRKSLKDAPHAFSAMGEAGRTNLGNLDQIISDAARHLETLTDPKKKADFLDSVIATLRQIGKTSPEAADAVRGVLPALKEVRDANKSVVIKADNADAMKKAAETSEALHDLATSRNRPRIEADDGPARHSIDGVKGLLMDLDGTRANPKISADTGAALSAINHVTTMLRNLNGTTATTYVRTVRNDIPLPGHAGGGLIRGPGGPRDDLIPARLSNREYVMQASAVDKYGVGMMDAINARRFAGGGSTGGRSSRGFSLFTSQEGADIVDSAHGIAQALKMLQAALAKSEKSLDKERQSRDDLQSQYDSIKSSVGSAYSSRDPFAAAQQTGSVWAAGGGMANPLAAFDAAVAGNTADTKAAQTALAFAQSHGLDGPLYAALAASGNLPLLQAFANLSSAEIDQREKAFAAQSNAQAALGGMAANAQVGAQLADANHHLNKLRDEVRDLRRDVREADQNNQKAQEKNAKDVKDGVNGAAAHGHKRGR